MLPALKYSDDSRQAHSGMTAVVIDYHPLIFL